jgi:hypothetical protein
VRGLCRTTWRSLGSLTPIQQTWQSCLALLSLHFCRSPGP